MASGGIALGWDGGKRVWMGGGSNLVDGLEGRGRDGERR